MIERAPLGVSVTPKGYRGITSELNKEQIKHIFFLKFVKTIAKKYGTNNRIPLGEVYRLLACLYSLDKRQSRLFVDALSDTYDFVRYNHRGLSLSVEV